MNQEKSFFQSVCNLAIPVALQSMLQASFSMVDQVMIGQLGSVAVAGVGLAGKFSSIYSVVVSAIGAVAGIMISQYLGQKKQREVKRSFYLNFVIAGGLAAFFMLGCGLFSKQIMEIYSKDIATIEAAADYLKMIAWTFLPLAGATLLSTLFRCMEKAALPLIASLVAAITNTVLNYILIFGKAGFGVLGAKGAAIATVVSQIVNFGIMFVMYMKYRYLSKKESVEETLQLEIQAERKADTKITEDKNFCWKQYMEMLLPILVCELLWSLGENVYAIIYGHLGTDSCAAMTLINPIQGMMIGVLCGLAQAASVIVGKLLGNQSYEEAYSASKKLIWYGLIGAICLSVVIVVTSSLYVSIYQVEESVKELTKQILIAYALVAPFKVLNMILGGGIIRSGGKTKYVMYIDMIGTWCFGVPLGLLMAFVFKLSIPYVYFILSLEEGIRFMISMIVFKKKDWMQSIQ